MYGYGKGWGLLLRASLEREGLQGGGGGAAQLGGRGAQQAEHLVRVGARVRVGVRVRVGMIVLG